MASVQRVKARHAPSPVDRDDIFPSDGHPVFGSEPEATAYRAVTLPPVRPQNLQTSITSATRHTPLPPMEIGQMAGTDRRTANRLRRGRMEIDARLDLHGYRQEEAHQRLFGFLSAANAAQARCVLVVTGKGRQASGETGKLKSAVPQWLNEAPFRHLVLSVTYAQQRDGGEGALYVLLRRKRETTRGRKGNTQ